MSSNPSRSLKDLAIETAPVVREDKPRPYKSSLLEVEKEALSPNILTTKRRTTKDAHHQGASIHRRNSLEDENKLEIGTHAELKQFVDILSQACERTRLLMQNKMAQVKIQYRKNAGAFDTVTPAWKTLVDLSSMITAASYLLRKSCHLLLPKQHAAPPKPTDGDPSDAEDALDTISWAISKITVSSTTLTLMLQKYVGAVAPENCTVLITDKGTVIHTEDISTILPSVAITVSQLMERLDMEQLRALPLYLEDIIRELNSLLRLTKPITSIKSAANVLLTAVHWLRKTGIKDMRKKATASKSP